MAYLDRLVIVQCLIIDNSYVGIAGHSQYRHSYFFITFSASHNIRSFTILGKGYAYWINSHWSMLASHCTSSSSTTSVRHLWLVQNNSHNTTQWIAGSLVIGIVLQYCQELVMSSISQSFSHKNNRHVRLPASISCNSFNTGIGQSRQPYSFVIRPRWLGHYASPRTNRIQLYNNVTPVLHTVRSMGSVTEGLVRLRPQTMGTLVTEYVNITTRSVLLPLVSHHTISMSNWEQYHWSVRLSNINTTGHYWINTVRHNTSYNALPIR